LIDRSVEAFTRGLYQLAPEEMTDEEIAEKKRLEEERIRLEEEERLRIEEEEAKNKKKKPKKGKEEEVFEEVLDPEDMKLHEMEHLMPVFEKGGQIFTSEFTFQYEEILDIIQVFRNKIFEFLSRKKSECMAQADISDKDFIQLSLHLLDERIRNYYSMKGKIQTEIFLIRSGEITRHKNRY
jgi:hypothetical protein